MLGHTLQGLPETVVFLMRAEGAYDPRRAWGDFDTLRLRAVDDLFFEDGCPAPVVYGFSQEPPHDGTAIAVALPLQVALERVFFHVEQNCTLVLNAPDFTSNGASRAQRGVTFSLPGDFPLLIEMSADQIPDILGALSFRGGGLNESISLADSALRKGSFFEAYSIAKEARIQGVETNTAWFYELYSYSFFGDPERALSLYEQYPERGGSGALSQLLAARYRLLLRQFNECRTILHTVSFKQPYGSLALTELARSYVIEGDYERALEHAERAIERDRTFAEAYLVRGLAERGLCYETAESEGLSRANRDFERVAQQGSYSAAEALYHAGTVCARLGLLDEAERAFRHSLFQRNKISPRDALIRVLVAREKISEAKLELELLSQLDSAHGKMLRTDVDLCVEESSKNDGGEGFGQRGIGREDSEQASNELRRWNIPVKGELQDFILLDELVNCFASDGDFDPSGEFSELASVGHKRLAQTVALHLGGILVAKERGTWTLDPEGRLCLKAARDDVTLPLESFVFERILLGASGDNFTSFESLIVDSGSDPVCAPALTTGWWKAASSTAVAEYETEIAWVTELFRSMGVELCGGLSDFERLDEWIEAHIEPGGAIASDALEGDGSFDMPRFVSAVGFFIGGIVSSMTRATWFEHEKSEGVSLLHRDLGRVFPVARAQRRIFLASAADFSLRFSSLAWSVGVASLTDDLRAGALKDKDDVRAALLERIPGAGGFPAQELAGVVESVLIGASLSQ